MTKPKEPTDAQFLAYTETRQHTDWVEENRGGRDWVEFEEANYDAIYESCCEWLDEIEQGARDDYEEAKSDEYRMNRQRRME